LSAAPRADDVRQVIDDSPSSVMDDAPRLELMIQAGQLLSARGY
jgi:hypothetical protein